jgi:signal transduction histidine kinase
MPHAGKRSMLERALIRGRFSSTGSSRVQRSGNSVREQLPALSRLVAVTSHDLRLPLTAILANAEFLTRSTLSEIERQEFYAEIRMAVTRMNEMISSLSEWSNQTETLRLSARNIVDTIEGAIRMTCVRREFRRITISYRHDGLAVGWFDSSRLERAIANLILNACEAVSPELGNVAITTSGGRASLQIVVSDNGPGIPESLQKVVFQPFVSYGKAHGNGLGLAIAKEIIEDHGGEISIDGSNPIGTSFKITIPFANSEEMIGLMAIGPIRPARNSRNIARAPNTL